MTLDDFIEDTSALPAPASPVSPGPRDILRLLTCGSVDDGKSTLIGRLLYDTDSLPEDQVVSLERDSRRYGTAGTAIEFALAVDGLEAEREQGITIDVSHRFFSTPRRSFIIVDTPGHEQYTRNMATGASTSDLAVILVDATKGVMPQTKRHSFICALLGIRHIVLAVNKMDLVGHRRDVFDRIRRSYSDFSARLGFASVTPIPLSALRGDMLAVRGTAMPWFDGPTLLEYLEDVDVSSARADGAFRFPVQWVSRLSPVMRGLAGRVASGKIRKGDEVTVARSGIAGRVDRIITFDAELEEARAGESVLITLDEEIDIGRGDLLTGRDGPACVGDRFAAHLIWFEREALVPGRSYLMRIGSHWTPASVIAIRHKVDVETADHRPASTLELNEIGLCDLRTTAPVAFDTYEENRDTGSFILVDRQTHQTAAAGMIAFPLHRATNIHPRKHVLDKDARARAKRQRPGVVWFTGLSAAGKSTIAMEAEQLLHECGYHTYVLDGDNLRHGVNSDLGFSDADRVENIRRAAEIAKLFLDSGLIVLCSFISPFRAERQMVRELFGEGEFIEAYVDTPLEECVRRDPKGLYALAKAGRITNFTGVDSTYEPPLSPEIVLDTMNGSVETLARAVVDHIAARDGQPIPGQSVPGRRAAGA